MDKKPLTVDEYLKKGCGRCSYASTPQCKVNSWLQELKALRKIALKMNLHEEIKWGVPCYTSGKKNICIISAFKEYASISFFKGSLIKDPDNKLFSPGDHSQASRLLKFTNTNEIKRMEKTISSFISQAIEIEKKGLKVSFKSVDEYPIPEELNEIFLNNPRFEKAFKKLTPGRQKGYLIYFSQPKQSATRTSRIEKCMDKIFQGIGFFDR